MKVAANNRQGRRIPQLSGLCVLLAAMTGCQHDAQIPTKPLVPVRLAEVTVYASGEGLRYSASLVPFAQVDVAFRTTGYVTDVKQIKADKQRGPFTRAQNQRVGLERIGDALRRLSAAGVTRDWQSPKRVIRCDID